MRVLLLMGLISIFAALMVVLARVLRGDGYGMLPGPRSPDTMDRWAMPHDDLRRSHS